jgi:hypothetical protein
VSFCCCGFRCGGASISNFEKNVFFGFFRLAYV